MFILKNYNRFLMGTTENYRWENFGTHRFKGDLAKILKFPSVVVAQQFLNEHSDVEERFDAWIVDADTIQWD